MPVQIGHAPIIYGEDAVNIMKEVKTIQSEKSKRNGQKLIKLFREY